MKFRKSFGVLAVFMLLFIAVACTSEQAPESETGVEKLKVVTSFYPLYFFTSEIVGDKASVINVTPVGQEPHDYEPSPQQMLEFESADLFVLNGYGFEPWANDLIKNLESASKQTPIVYTPQWLVTKQMQHEDGLEDDPHVWLSPLLAQELVENIALGLMRVDKENADFYRQNADNLKQKLQALHREFEEGIAQCSNVSFITSHAAFAYLADTYGLKQVSIAGLSPEEEPSAAQMVEIVKFAKEHNVKYIFFEELVSPKLSDTIANEIGAQTLVLNPLEGLTDEEKVANEDYFSVMRNNLANLKIALACK